MAWSKPFLLVCVFIMGFWMTRAYMSDAPLAPPVGDHFAQAEYFYFASHYDQAVKEYRDALTEGLEEPKAKDAYFRIAISLQHLERNDEAIRAYQEASRRYPRSAEANHALGEVERIKLHHNLN